MDSGAVEFHVPPSISKVTVAVFGGALGSNFRIKIAPFSTD